MLTMAGSRRLLTNAFWAPLLLIPISSFQRLSRMYRSLGKIRLLVALSVLILSACAFVPEADDSEGFESVPTLTEPVVIVASSYTAPPPRTPFECASQLPLQNRIGQLMFPLMTPADFAVAQNLVSLGLLGGVVVLGSPSPSIRDAIANFQKRSLYGPSIVAVDEEGGRVQRLAKLTSRMPSARSIANTLNLNEARLLAADHADAIGNLGFTMNLAPVADIDYGRAIGDRSFGKNASVVSDFAMATAEGILDAGLVPVLKHFPGHGRGTDSHFGLPVIPGVEVLRRDDLLPFTAVSDRKDVPIMVGHLVVEGLTNGQPASVSPAAIDGLLRQDLGFQGLVMSDAFNMNAISETLTDAEAAELSIAAGVDLVMLSSLRDVGPAVNRIYEAVNSGRISEKSITDSFLRAMHTRSINVCELAAFH